MRIPTPWKRFVLRAAAGKRPGEYAAQFDWGLTPVRGVPPDGVIVYRLGWGWDGDLPLRPWPACHMTMLERAPRVHEHAARQDFCVAFLGLYFGMCKYWDVR
jgi:hypothetical protein